MQLLLLLLLLLLTLTLRIRLTELHHASKAEGAFTVLLLCVAFGNFQPCFTAQVISTRSITSM